MRPGTVRVLVGSIAFTARSLARRSCSERRSPHYVIMRTIAGKPTDAGNQCAAQAFGQDPESDRFLVRPAAAEHGKEGCQDGQRAHGAGRVDLRSR